MNSSDNNPFEETTTLEVTGEELEELHNLLGKEKEEPVTIQEAVDKIKEDQGEYKALKKKYNAQTRSLKKAKGEVKTLKDKEQKHAKEKSKQTGHVKKLEKDIEKLEKDIEELTSDLKLARQEKEDLLAAVNGNKEGEEEFDGTTSSFFIHLYYRDEEEFNGWIRHMVTGDRENVSGKNKAGILDFIDTHKPVDELEAKPVASSSSDEKTTTNGASEKKTEEPVEEELIEEEKPVVDDSVATPEPKMRKLDLVSLRTGLASHILNEDEPFNARLRVDIKSISERKTELLNYKATIFAKSLEDGRRHKIGEVEDAVLWSDVFDATVEKMSLPAGSYRLETIVSFDLKDVEQPAPVRAFHESNLVLVE